ncbi:MAG: hypothetical protein GYA15_06685 [Leptolinea sp.]|jgi:hypothetical protein|nr:hypothetical protein [Leptolinea sp.]
MNSLSGSSSVPKTLNNEQFCQLLEKAIQIPQPRFVRQAAAAWLGMCPGDLKIQGYMAAAQLFEGKKEQAAEIIQKVLKIDPEFREGYEVLLKCLPENASSRAGILSNIYILGGKITSAAEQPEWVQNLRAARLSYINQQVSTAEKYLHKAIGAANDNVLCAILHLQITRANSDTQAVQNLASLYSQRWPDCVLFSLYLAEAQMELGSEVLAVNLLHDSAAKDSGAQVAVRIWGKEFPYKSIWPEINNFEFNIPVPSSVAAIMGWNQLGTGGVTEASKPTPVELKRPIRPEPIVNKPPSVETVSTKKTETPIHFQPVNQSKGTPASEKPHYDIRNLFKPVKITVNTSGMLNAAGKAVSTVSSMLQTPKIDKPVRDVPIAKVKEELRRVAINLDKSGIATSDHRFPVMVILSLRSGLEKQFGQQTLSVIDTELRTLAANIGKMPEWSARVIYADDPDSTGKIGLNPVENGDPWKIKLLLTDLDGILAKKGEMIGSLLIIGGPEVVPFHRLPNPTDDLDDEVLSDSPYSTCDSNYFVPEWSVSRLPGGKGPDAGLLLEEIRRLNQSVQNKKQQFKIDFHLPPLPLFSVFQTLLTRYPVFGNYPMFGYTAEIWKRSSEEVFLQINKSKNILSSPPLNSDTVPGMQAVSAPVSYFNLHGLVDSSEWYGQRDTSITQDGPDYPVAIKPDDLYRSTQENGIIFSEACYGGHISGKGEEDSIALKFLATGSACVVGSTCTSYGAVSLPLIGADLLGFHFLKHLDAGMSTGEALYQARLDFIQEMQKRQGYLDGEDQKTLISFVMYGNPFSTVRKSTNNSKTIHRFTLSSEVCPVCTKEYETELPKRMGEETLAKIKQVVEPYLPGLNNAEMHYSRIHTECSGKNHSCPTSEIHLKGKPQARSGKMVVSIRKSITSANRTHPHFARVTLDSRGKMVKLAVSR